MTTAAWVQPRSAAEPRPLEPLSRVAGLPGFPLPGFPLAVSPGLWELNHTMKRNRGVRLGLVLALLLTAPVLLAQYMAPRSYMKRLAPPAPPPQRAPQVPSPTPPGQVFVPAAPVDPEKARAEKEAMTKRTVEFQKKRAEAGSATAQYDLGLRYLKGEGVEKNLVEARKWFEAAAKQGHPFAAKKLEEIKDLPELKAPTPAPALEKRSVPAETAPTAPPKPAS